MATKCPAKKLKRVIPVRSNPKRPLSDAQQDAIDVAYIQEMEKRVTKNSWIEYDEMKRRLGWRCV